MRAIVPTSNRTSPPPTSLPRSMRTTPNSPSPSRQLPHHHPIARLEHVQRQHRVREQHRCRAGTSGVDAACSATSQFHRSVPPGSGVGPRPATTSAMSSGARRRDRRVRAFDPLGIADLARDARSSCTCCSIGTPGIARCSSHNIARLRGIGAEAPLLEVGEHAGQDRMRWSRLEVGRAQRPRAAVHHREQSRAVVAGRARAPPWNGSHHGRRRPHRGRGSDRASRCRAPRSRAGARLRSAAPTT